MLFGVHKRGVQQHWQTAEVERVLDLQAVSQTDYAVPENVAGQGA